LFQGDGDGTYRGKTDLVVLHARDETAINEVVMTLVTSLAAVFFGQLDPIALDLINRTNMDTIRADYFHVLFDLISAMAGVPCEGADATCGRSSDRDSEKASRCYIP
jgi:hypothetical protein